MTEYLETMFANFDKLEYNTWYRIDPNRPDAKKLKDALIVRINLKYDFEFNGAFTSFRRIFTDEDFGEQNREYNRQLIARRQVPLPPPHLKTEGQKTKGKRR